MSRLDFLYSSDVSSKAVAVFLYLLDHANKQGECWPSIPTIAEDLKISESTVRRAVKELKKAGLLTTEQRYRQNGGKSSLCYKLKSGVPPLKRPSERRRKNNIFLTREDFALFLTGGRFHRDRRM